MNGSLYFTCPYRTSKFFLKYWSRAFSPLLITLTEFWPKKLLLAIFINRYLGIRLIWSLIRKYLLSKMCLYKAIFGLLLFRKYSRGKVSKCSAPFWIGHVSVCRTRRADSNGIKRLSPRGFKLERINQFYLSEITLETLKFYTYYNAKDQIWSLIVSLLGADSHLID